MCSKLNFMCYNLLQLSFNKCTFKNKQKIKQQQQKKLQKILVLQVKRDFIVFALFKDVSAEALRHSIKTTKPLREQLEACASWLLI